jgi:hypothetical protein
VTAHAVVGQVVPAGIAETFDLIHGYPARLQWDTLLRRAETVGGVAPAKGVEAICSARWSLGGLTFRTRYVTFRRPDLAAVTLVRRPRCSRAGPPPSGTSPSARDAARSSTPSPSALAQPDCPPDRADRPHGLPLGDPPAAAGSGRPSGG